MALADRIRTGKSISFATYLLTLSATTISLVSPVFAAPTSAPVWEKDEKPGMQTESLGTEEKTGVPSDRKDEKADPGFGQKNEIDGIEKIVPTDERDEKYN